MPSLSLSLSCLRGRDTYPDIRRDYRGWLDISETTIGVLQRRGVIA